MLGGHQMNTLSIGAASPMFMFETVPGETYEGSINYEAITNPTTALFLNRMYLDVFVFYVPYRIAWTQFPNFISQGDTGYTDDSTVPTEVPKTDISTIPLSEFFWAKQGYEDTGVYYISDLPWYSLISIYNKYFNNTDLTAPIDPAAAPYSTNSLTCTRKGQDYHKLLYEVSDMTSGAVDTTDIDALRQSFASDRWQKARDIYGTKYTDYLATMGVKSQTGMIDDPDPIGRSSSKFKYACGGR